MITTGIAGILLNLLVVTTVRHHDHLQTSTTNLLLLNLCFSNLIISFLGEIYLELCMFFLCFRENFRLFCCLIKNKIENLADYENNKKQLINNCNVSSLSFAFLKNVLSSESKKLDYCLCCPHLNLHSRYTFKVQ